LKIALLMASLGNTGYHVNTIRLGSGLRSYGYDVDLVLMSCSGSTYRHLIRPEINIFDLGSPRLWTSLLPLVKYLRQNKPDVIISAAPLANGIAGWAKLLVRSRTSLIMTERGLKLFGFAERGPFRWQLLKLFLMYGYRQADAVVAVSMGVAKQLRSLRQVPFERIHVIYNPVWSPELEILSRQEIDHPWLSQPSKVPVIVAAGRLAEEKGFDTLLKAFALVRREREARLILLGEGDEREALIRLRAQLGLNEVVDMPGFKEDPQRYMRRASVFVLTSTHEAFGNVLVESMACGIPVVSTDCPTGPREILEDGKYGILVPVADPEALAKGILSALSTPVDRDALQERAKNFSVEASTRQYLELVSRLQSPSHNPR
jgi:glycosyltransferase involved in cell wall biosynthesis